VTPPPAGPLVDVVVVSYESRDCVVPALRSAIEDAGVPATVTLVDNASSDGTADAVRVELPSVRVITNRQNLGFGAACNQGWRGGSAPFALFLNPDAALRRDALAALLRVLESRPDAGIAGPLTRNADGTVQVSTGPDLTLAGEWHQRRLVRGVARRDPRALARAAQWHADEREVDWVSGSCLLARRSCLEQTGGFDEGFFLYEEDADLCRRARAAGWKVLFTPAAEAVHQVGRSMARAPLRAAFEYQRSHLLYYRRHNGAASRLALRALIALRAAAAGARAVAAGEPAERSAAAAMLALALGLRS
jgi:N-acetylglucosaminyl-diphospho-decaprenol L-rhamnosyltransferase